ncbi:MAG: hypothetical protein IPM29_02800 [Planctomycetes bacterium]|nr:hypothetical protein [Planctomycetota bacterium]
MERPSRWSTPRPPATPRTRLVPPPDGFAAGEQASSLPTSTFGARDPEVERGLSEAAGDVLLRFLAREAAGQDDESATQSATSGRREDARNAVGQDELTALFEHLHAAPAEPPDDLSADLEAERAFVLADVAAAGDGLARQIASRELQAFSTDPLRLVDLGREVLVRLADGIDTLPPAGFGSCALLRVLRIAARRALAEATRSPAPLEVRE